MRSLLSIVIAVLYLILTLPVLGILTLIGKKHPDTKDRATQAMIQWVFRLLTTAAGTRITVKGLENIPSDEAVLFVGNHRSIYDIMITYPHMTRTTGYVAKSSLDKIPIFRIWFRNIHCLFFNRDNLKEGMQMILDGIKQIKSGENVFIFPEGTRQKSEEDLPLLPFHEGSFRIATKSGCKIVPVALNNTVQIFEAHLPWLHRTHVVVEYLPPVDPASYSKQDQKRIGAIIRDQVTQAIEANAGLV